MLLAHGHHGGAGPHQIGRRPLGGPPVYLLFRPDVHGDTTRGPGRVYGSGHRESRYHAIQFGGLPLCPYRIRTADQLNKIGLFPCEWDKQFNLVADIDLARFTGTEFNTIGLYGGGYLGKPFTGVFDGCGHTISNFTHTTGTESIFSIYQSCMRK